MPRLTLPSTPVLDQMDEGLKYQETLLDPSVSGCRSNRTEVTKLQTGPETLSLCDLNGFGAAGRPVFHVFIELDLIKLFCPTVVSEHIPNVRP